MTDITTPLTELRAAYRAYQNAKRDKKEEITEKYRSRMEDEIRAAVQAEKYAFASLLKDRKDFYDLRVTDIQDHVLRTRNWKVWEDIRDFADIEPEQIIRSNAREAKALAARTYRWIPWNDNAFGFALVLTKTEKGEAFDSSVRGVEGGEVILRDIRVKDGEVSAWPEMGLHTEVWNRYWDGQPVDMKKYASKIANDHKAEAIDTEEDR